MPVVGMRSRLLSNTPSDSRLTQVIRKAAAPKKPNAAVEGGGAYMNTAKPVT